MTTMKSIVRPLRKALKNSICAISMATMLIPAAHAFGGEDVRHGRPWHHLDMTLRALAGDENAGAATPGDYFEGAGFSRDAAMSVAWHADYIDSYLYNPIFWAQGGLTSRRFKAAMAMFDDLAKLHHDDTFTTAGLKDNWKRYGAGTLIGLYWASMQGDNGDVAAAHNILGVSVHALQDFYSHTNWMDNQGRRNTTWLSTPVATRDGYSLYSGGYELPEHQAPHHHGAYSLSCSILNRSAVQSTIGSLCGGLSPIQSTSLCTSYRACQGGEAVRMNVSGIETDDLVYLHPTGIALDTTLITRIGARERNLIDQNGASRGNRAQRGLSPEACNKIVNFGVSCDHDVRGETCTRIRSPRQCQTDSDYLFAQTKRLAGLTTTQWVNLIGEAMEAMGPRQAAFWQRVKTTGSTVTQRERQFEYFSQLPFQFLSTGPFPIANPRVGGHASANSSDGYFLRLKIRTSNDSLSGTDADIKAIVRGSGNQRREFLLDYLPTSNAEGRTDNRLLVYNDFEQGDNDVYTIGPMPFEPRSVTLKNEAADAGDVFEALWDDFVDGLDELGTDLRRLFIGIIGGNADYLGTTSHHAHVNQLMATIRADGGTSRRSMVINAGNDGRYRVYFTYREVNSGLTAQQRRDGWKAIEFSVDQLKCHRESEWDRGSNSDEPFVFISISALNGLADNRLWTYRRGPFNDVDDGETRNMRRNDNSHKTIVKLPPEGGVVLAMQMFESDDENTHDRNQLYQTFRTGLDEETRRGNGRFIDAVGSATASDWKVRSMEVFAFQRTSSPRVSDIQTFNNIGWIDGGESRTFNLDNRVSRRLIGGGIRPVSDWYVAPALTISPEITDRLADAARGPTIPTDTIDAITSGPIIIPGSTIMLDPSHKWQGSWSTNFGELRLHSNTGIVTGDYANRGQINGNWNGETGLLTGTFNNNERRGVFSFSLNAEGTAFSGDWKWDGETDWRGSWDGNKTSSERPELRNE